MISKFYGWSFDDFMKTLGNGYPMFSHFSQTIQDQDWHQEGDLKTHTNMVLSEVYLIIDKEKMTESEQNILILAALFHDYGKPIVTQNKEKNGEWRIVAPRHEEIGASLLFHLSSPLNISSSDWFDVIRLVAYHDMPKKLIIKNKDKKDFHLLSRHVSSLKLLYWLELADMRGRYCNDKHEQLELLELFKYQLEEYDLWANKPYCSFKDEIKEYFNLLGSDTHDRVFFQAIYNYEQGIIHMLEEELSRAYSYKDKQAHLVILCGVSSSGKSTFIQKNLKDYRLISLDLIREEYFGNRCNQKNNNEVRRIASDILKESLRNKEKVVWDATNIRRDFRSKIATMGFNYGAFVELVVLQKNINDLIKDNKTRHHSVLPEIIQEQVKKFQMPYENEAHKTTWVFNN